jgi:nucleoside-diphosphate-sugar epimerase
MSTGDSATAVFGATGYLGTLATAALLAEERCRLILPVRGGRSREQVVRPILAECAASGHRIESANLDRLEVTDLPDTGQISRLAGRFRDLGVDRIVHGAGSVHYFDRAKLNAGNVELTDAIAQLAHCLNVERLFYFSTAFSCGYRSGRVPERLHPAPASDPTDYTWSKREAEYILARSGVPFVIIRPSVVVGDSRDGRYSGKCYGVYQLWHAAERLLGTGYPPVIHAVAPPIRLHLLHQDAFQAGFLACYRHSPAGRFVHLVSREEALPTLRELYQLWFQRCAPGTTFQYYDSLEEVAVDELDSQQRLWLEFTGVNLQIACHPWSFETGNLDDLASRGPEIAHATLQTLAVCQEHFITASPRLQEFLRGSKIDGEPTQIHEFRPRRTRKWSTKVPVASEEPILSEGPGVPAPAS